VVIAIIALLASLLLPALRGARDRAGLINCLARSRGLGLAFGMYVSDSADFYPIMWYWREADFLGTTTYSETFAWRDQYGTARNLWTFKDVVQPYVETTTGWQCPVQQRKTWGAYAYAGYTYNPSIGGGSPFNVYEHTYLNRTWVKAQNVQNPNLKVLVGCAAEGQRPDGAITVGHPLGSFYWDMPRYNLGPVQWNSWPPPGDFITVNNHVAACPVLFADSHGDMMTVQDNFGVTGPSLSGDYNKWLDIRF
jgi:type II secretory pathway pseudopilin PulG